MALVLFSWQYITISLCYKISNQIYGNILSIKLPGKGQLAGFIFEVPSGYIADHIGHKKALMIARFSLALSTLCYVLANSITWFFVGAILMALSIAFQSGTNSVFMHETLKGLGKEDQYSKIMGKIESLGFALPVIPILLLPIIAEHNFHLAFIIAFIIDIIGLIAVASLVHPPAKENLQTVSLDNIKETFSQYFKVGWLPWIIFTTITFGFYMGTLTGFKNPYQEMIGFSISMLGVFWASSRVFTSLLSLTSGWIYKKFTYKQLLILRSLLIGIGILVAGLTTNKWIIAISFASITSVMWGTRIITNQHELSFIKNSPYKATFLSTTGLAQNLVFAGLGVTMGFLVARFDFAFSFTIMGSVLLFFTLLGFIFIPRKKP